VAAARFGMLGRVVAGIGRREADLPQGHPSTILAALLAEPNRSVDTGDLIEAVWGGEPPRTAANTLQVHVGSLRRSLRAVDASLAERLVTDPSGYRLRVEPGELDAELFTAELGEARRADRSGAKAAAELLRRALGRWRGSVLEGIDSRTPGGEAAAALLEEQRLDAIELLAELELRLGRAAAVAEELDAALRAHPFRERLHALRMLALYRSGRQADALAAYQRARSTLAEELGVEPGPELRALELAILRHDPALLGAGVAPGDAATSPDATSTSDGGSELPAQATPFIGRRAELDAFVARLPGERLVTVVGVGGSGKTRFAIQAAGLASDSFPDGIRMIDLGATTDAERLVLAIAGLYGIGEQPGRDLLDVVGAALGSGRRLLILDTCEHLVGAVADAASKLLDLAPGLTILATSREPLRLAAELVWRLRPLGSDDVESDRESLLADDAVRLFMERAERVGGGRAWSDADVRTIRRICQRLDGLPLAIEMAAARSAVLSPSDIDDRLGDRFGLLAGGDRSGVARHRTLRAAFDWSFDLLSPSDQATLCRLAVFAAPASPRAVEAVCADGAVPDPMRSAMSLAERSLAVAAIDADGRSRFGLLDTVREYGEARLRDAGATAEVAGRYVAWWTGVAADAYRRRVNEPDDAATALESDWEELRSAADRAHELEPAAELRLVGLLGWFLVHHTHIAEGRRLLDRALAIPDGDEVDRARALVGRAGIASAQGDVALAETDGAAAVETWRRVGDRLEEAFALDALGWARFWAGDDAGSLASFEEAVAIADALGATGLIRRTRAGLGQVVVAIGDVARARPLAEDLARLAAGDLWAQHLAVHYVADCDLLAGDPAAALGHYREALVLASEMGNTTETAIEIEGVAMALAGIGSWADGVRLLAAAEAELERIGVQLEVPFWSALRARYIGPAEVALGPAATSAWSAGRAMSFAEAIAFSGASAPVAKV